MSNDQPSSEQVENSLKYELFLSQPLDEDLIRSYKKHVTDASNCQIQDFDLKPNPDLNSCYGQLKFDQNIEEEWLVIHSLFELSKLDQDLVIKVHDHDGEILLIEAAEHLPQWLESKRSKDRCYIHRGKLHIIPKTVDLRSLAVNGSIKMGAAKFVRDVNNTSNSNTRCGASSFGSRVKTVANTDIQTAIAAQLRGLPDKSAWLQMRFENLHKMICNNDGSHDIAAGKKKLTLASVMAMADEELETSPLSSTSSSPV